MRKITRAPLVILLLLGLAHVASAQTYTIAPSPFGTVLDNSGHIVVSGCVWTYQSGTTTLITTYADNAGTPNANPIIADFAGRFTAYLLAGTNYKFVYENVPCSSSAHGSVLRTADSIAGVPGAAATVDISTAVAGEAISAGQCVYLSDGSGSKTAGQWFKCDSANTYSSTTPETGIATAAIASTATGSVRLAGSVTGLSSLSVGAEYYVGSSGALTSTAPTNRRHMGHADSATTLVLTGDPPPPTAFISPTITTSILSDKLWTQVCQGRLTLTTVTPVTTSDVTAATTLRYTPYAGNNIALYDGSATWTLMSFSELSIAVPATTSQMYDVFVFNSSGTATLELLAWTNDTTRATALALQDGVLVKTGATTRRYVGSMRTTTVSGQTEDSVTNRFVWNYYNRVERPLKRIETNTSWTYASATIHQANASASNQVNFIVGVSEDPVDAMVGVTATYPTSTNVPIVGFGLDSTTTYAGDQFLASGFAAGSGGGLQVARYRGFPGLGKHSLMWNESVVNSGTAVTFYSGANASIGGVTTGAGVQSGIVGSIKG